MKKLHFIVFALVLLSACEKEIDLNLDDKSGYIVIEGNVTDQPGPYYVRVTKSVAFTEANQYPVVTDALVTISDNKGQTEVLQYDADGRYKTSNLVSVPGNTYTLTVTANGITYSAQSTMPQAAVMDSLTQDLVAIGGDERYSFLPVFTDPPALGNRYLFILSVNERKDKTFQTFSDNIDNGMINKRSLFFSMDEDEDKKVKKGDTVHVQMRCIDQSIYTYYTALSQLLGGGGGPGGSVTPANPPGNISNGALGVFSAHTTNLKSIVVE